MTFVTHFDIRRCFQYKILPLFFDCFSKSWWSAPKMWNCDFKFAFYIKPSLMHRLPDNKWFNILYERFAEFKILRIWDENINFIIFNFLGKRSEIEHRLHRIYWTFRCYGIGYGFNWRYYSSFKPTAFIGISHFQNSMLN